MLSSIGLRKDQGGVVIEAIIMVTIVWPPQDQEPLQTEGVLFLLPALKPPLSCLQPILPFLLITTTSLFENYNKQYLTLNTTICNNISDFSAMPDNILSIYFFRVCFMWHYFILLCHSIYRFYLNWKLYYFILYIYHCFHCVFSCVSS